MFRKASSSSTIEEALIHHHYSRDYFVYKFIIPIPSIELHHDTKIFAQCLACGLTRCFHLRVGVAFQVQRGSIAIVIVVLQSEEAFTKDIFESRLQ
jgi:hypothetical protein